MSLYQKIIQRFENKYKENNTPWVDHGKTKELIKSIALIKKEFPEGKILDLGCGQGWLSHELAKEGFTVLGIDSSKSAIAAAKEHAISSKETFEVCDVLSFEPSTEPFDVIVDRGLLHHIPQDLWPQYHEVLEKSLSPHGLYYLIAFGDNSVKKGFSPKKEGKMGNIIEEKDGDMSYDHFFNASMIPEIFGDKYEILSIKEEAHQHKNGSQLLHTLMRKK